MTNHRKRKATDKVGFLKSVRQIWLLIIFLLGSGVLIADLKSDIEAKDYLEFLLITGSVFIIGSSVDSALKIQKENPKNEE